MPKRDDINKVMIIGSGPIVIGQACEFDYSGTQACKALRKLGYEIILANSYTGSTFTSAFLNHLSLGIGLNFRPFTSLYKLLKISAKISLEQR